MTLQQILSEVRTIDGVLEVAPQPGSDYPEIAWGDHFFYYAPDGQVPRRQPYATIVTKDYPDDTASRLDGTDQWRLNIHVGPRVLSELIGYDPAEVDDSAVDFSAEDVFNPHPLYGPYGCVSSTLEPGLSTGRWRLWAVLTWLTGVGSSVDKTVSSSHVRRISAWPKRFDREIRTV